MPTPSENQLPDPHPDFASRNNIESAGKNAFKTKAQLWQFKNTTMEEPAATCSRYALRLIDKVTGKAYTADELLNEYLPETPGYTIGDSAPVNAYAGIAQKVALTITSVGTITPFTFKIITNGGTVISSYPIASAPDQTAAITSINVRNAVAADLVLAQNWEIEMHPSTYELTLTKKSPYAAYDEDLRMELWRSATLLETSTLVDEGAATVIATVAPPFIRAADGFMYIQDAGIWKQVALSALASDPAEPPPEEDP